MQWHAVSAKTFQTILNSWNYFSQARHFSQTYTHIRILMWGTIICRKKHENQQQARDETQKLMTNSTVNPKHRSQDLSSLPTLSFRQRRENPGNEVGQSLATLVGLRDPVVLCIAQSQSRAWGIFRAEVYLQPILYHELEPVSIECGKTKTKVITLANQKARRQSSKPIKTRSNYT